MLFEPGRSYEFDLLGANGITLPSVCFALSFNFGFLQRGDGVNQHHDIPEDRKLAVGIRPDVSPKCFPPEVEHAKCLC